MIAKLQEILKDLERKIGPIKERIDQLEASLGALSGEESQFYKRLPNYLQLHFLLMCDHDQRMRIARDPEEARKWKAACRFIHDGPYLRGLKRKDLSQLRAMLKPLEQEREACHSILREAERNPGLPPLRVCQACAAAYRQYVIIPPPFEPVSQWCDDLCHDRADNPMEGPRNWVIVSGVEFKDRGRS